MADSFNNWHVLKRATGSGNPFVDVGGPAILPGTRYWDDPDPVPASGNDYRLTQTTANGIVVPYNDVSIVPGNPGDLKWTKIIPENAGAISSIGQSVAIDHLNNSVLAGQFRGSFTFGGITYQSDFNGDILVAKCSTAGTLLVEKGFGGANLDVSTSITVDSQNNMLVSGYFLSPSIDFGNGIVITNHGAADTADIFVAKFSPSGSCLWAKAFGSVGGDSSKCIGVDSGNNVVFIAQFAGTVSFGNVSLTSIGNTGIAVVKLSGTDGSTMWAKRWGGTSYNEPQGVAVDKFDNVWVTGRFVGTSDFGNGSVTGAAGQNIFLAKYSGSDGGHLWSMKAGTTGTNMGNAVTADPTTGNIFLTGAFQDSVDLGGGPVGGPWGGGIFLAAYDNSGSYFWAVGSGQNFDAGTSVSADGNGHVALTGSVVGAIYWPGGDRAYGGNGNANYFVSGFDFSQNAPVSRWTKRVNTGTISGGNGVTFDTQGRVLAVGKFQGTVDFGGITLSAPLGTAYPAAFIAQYLA